MEGKKRAKEIRSRSGVRRFHLPGHSQVRHDYSSFPDYTNGGNEICESYGTTKGGSQSPR